MRKKLSTKIRGIVFGIMLLTMFLAAFGPGGLPAVHAQEGSTGTPAGTPPPQPPTISGKDPGSQPAEREGVPGATRAENGQWLMPAGNEAAGQDNAGESMYSSSKTDDFGYTWKTPKTYSWIDTSGGTDTGITTSNYSTGPVDIGFPFKYYENTYSQIHISLYGFLSFHNSYLYDNQSYIPDASPPNDVIAPYWSPVDDIYGYVHYLQGGAAPNRWFAVEWNQLYSYGNTITFEAILYENGNIDFQYGNMIRGSSGWWCQASGIEDSTGMVGLSITGFCVWVKSTHAVNILRPAPSARVGLFPLYFGGFVSPGGNADLQIGVHNTGDLGTDTYTLAPSSVWPVSLFASDGTTPLADTNGDGKIDTGPVAQGDTVNFVARVHAPASAVAGSAVTGKLLVSSTLNKAKKKTAMLQAAVPAPFAQAYKTSYFGAMTTLLAQPAGQQSLLAGDAGWWDYDPALAQAPNGNLVAAWDRGYCPSSGGGTCYINYDIDYTILDYSGAVVRPLSKLTDNSAQTTQTMDEYPAVAVAPNGSIGVIWYRYLRDNATSQINYNIFFAILDDAGEIIYGPTNLTNNAVWSTSDSQYVPVFTNPQISATGDNRFILAWHESYYGATSGSCSSYCSVDDLYYAVRDTANAEVVPVTQFTYDTPGWNEAYTNPNLTALAGNRALLTWRRYSDDDVYYAVLGSDGSLVKGQTDLSKDKWKKYDYAPDAMQLSDGRILIAWGCYDSTGDNIRFSVLDANFKQVVAPKLLKTPAALTGSDYVSVTADAAGNAILTWTDSSYYFRRSLYYALLTSKGKIVTQPMVFQTSPDKYMLSSYVGNGNTTYLSNPAAMPALSNKFTPAPDWNDPNDLTGSE